MNKLQNQEKDSKEEGQIKIRSVPVLTAHEVRIYSDFKGAEWAEPLVELLENATEQDHITLRINSAGGDCEGLVPILTAMENCEAHIHGVIEGTGAASAAAFTALKCDSLEVASKYAKLMIHGAQVGLNMHSPVQQIVDVAQQSKDLSDTLLNDCLGFLSEEEILAAKRGADLYFSAKEIEERWKKFKPEPEEIKESNEEANG